MVWPVWAVRDRIRIMQDFKVICNCSVPPPSLTLVNPKSRSKAFIYQAGATFQFRSDMCYILSCGSWFDFFGAFYDVMHLSDQFFYKRVYSQGFLAITSLAWNGELQARIHRYIPRLVSSLTNR